jgi:hypothetical protein
MAGRQVGRGTGAGNSATRPGLHVQPGRTAICVCFEWTLALDFGYFGFGLCQLPARVASGVARLVVSG